MSSNSFTPQLPLPSPYDLIYIKPKLTVEQYKNLHHVQQQQYEQQYGKNAQEIKEVRKTG